MECKKCGKILSEQERFCTYCGYYNDPDEEINEGFSEKIIKEDKEIVTTTHTDKNEKTAVEKVVYENVEKLKPRCLKVFLTTDYKVVTTGGFNIYALLFSWIYFIYKKIYIIGLPGLIVTGLLVLTQPVILIIYIVISMVISGLFFNKIYLWYANHKVDKIISNNSPEESIKLAKKAGKDNVLITLGIYFIFLVLIIILYFTKDLFGFGGDKYYKENTNNKNKCLQMIDAAKRNSSSSSAALIIESGCIVLNSTNLRYQVFLKFNKGDKIIIEQYSTDIEKMYLDGSTDLLTEYEIRKSELNEAELKRYQEMLDIQDNYSKLQQNAKAEDEAIKNKTNTLPKKYFLIKEDSR